MTNPDPAPQPPQPPRLADDLDFATPSAAPTPAPTPAPVPEPVQAAAPPPPPPPAPASTPATPATPAGPSAATPGTDPANAAAPAEADSAWQEIADPEDVRKNKGVAILAYILFFMPLVVAEKSTFARFHANQSLILLIVGGACTFGCYIIHTVLGVVLGAAMGAWGTILAAPFMLLFIACWFVWMGMTGLGIFNAYNGHMKELPVIGHYSIIKRA